MYESFDDQVAHIYLKVITGQPLNEEEKAILKDYPMED